MFLNSCNTYFNITKQDETSKVEGRKQIDVLRIHTSDDGLVYFSKKYPGKLYGGEIIGVKQVPFKLFSADSVEYKVRRSREIPRFAYSNGSKFEVFKNNNLDFVYTSTLIKVPLAEASNIEFRREADRALIFPEFVAGVSALSIYIISNMTLNVGETF